MLFKENMIVILKKGRLAGKKAVILKINEDSLILGGINRVPYKVEDHVTSQEKRRSLRFLTFIKKSKQNHVIATRFVSECELKAIELKDIESDIVLKTKANSSLNSVLKTAFLQGKSKFLFTELKF